jgi:WhiB family transcriptional regulator, redox-sensing transcriptional regulator
MSLAWQRDDWRSAGACLSADPELFFPISSSGSSSAQIALAKAICAVCRVQAECAEFALAHRDMDGIWGGTTDEERRKLRRARPRQPVPAGQAPRRQASGAGTTAA